jgi:hypothetical protein
VAGVPVLVGVENGVAVAVGVGVGGITPLQAVPSRPYTN